MWICSSFTLFNQDKRVSSIGECKSVYVKLTSVMKTNTNKLRDELTPVHIVIIYIKGQ